MTHYFHNDRAINPIFFNQFGLSIKQEGAIGQFGTGLKHAIAIILRGGGKIRAQSGGNVYDFSTRTIKIDDHEVEVVTMNGNDLSFTTNLGKNWAPWMAFRELISNAWDEGGGYSTTPPDAYTTFIVNWSEFDELKLEDYFILDSDPLKFTCLAEEDEIKIIKEHRGKAFYKGVRVKSNPEWHVGFILKGEAWRSRLTEERQLSDNYYLEACFRSAVYDQDDDRILELWQEFDSTAMDRMLGMPPMRLMDRFVRLYEAGAVRSDTARAAILQWERDKPPLIREPRSDEMLYINRALIILEKAGLECRWPILIREHAHNTTMASVKGDTIYLNNKTFSRGLKEIVKCLVEEITHLEYGTSDETYAHQHALLDQWIRAVCKLTGEII